MFPARGQKDEYLALVKKFPPRPIHDSATYDKTVEVMNRLAVRDESTLSLAEADYLEALATFVEAYDRNLVAQAMPKRSPVQVLKYLMSQNNMKPADLGRLLGSSGLATEILNQGRSLSKAHIRILATRFAVSPALFLE
jgi:HTH-type transcriptional regulator/antitoxin HigA